MIMFGSPSPMEQRIKKLQSHLSEENPVLLDVVKSFRQLDRVAYRLGILDRDESFTTRVPWWPMVSILGTFSSGKSTFINGYLGARLQNTGNQAVDDKFTVICYAAEDGARILPGRALDADPRFPFYQMSHAIDEVAPGEGERIDMYLQLKTCKSNRLRGKIVIDSPGFDADEQRNSTLRITDRIIDLSDLVLVFFDARHPEPGAMQDTLEHLVTNTINRADSNKFLYVLNQIDNAAREDNPEEVFGAWQRALAQKGLTAGRFYSIYDPDAAIAIDDPKLRARFESKRTHDVKEIETRIEQVEVERAYRIIGVLEQSANAIQDRVVPALRQAKERWRRRILWLDALAFGSVLLAFLAWSISGGYWSGFRFTHPWFEQGAILSGVTAQVVLAAVLLAGGIYVHFLLRKLAAGSVLAGLRREQSLEGVREWVLRGFAKNVRPWQWMITSDPAGWSGFVRRKLDRVLADANRYVQALNSRFADPSGTRSAPDAPPGDQAETASGEAPKAPAPSPPPAEVTPLSAAVEQSEDYPSPKTGDERHGAAMVEDVATGKS